MARAKTTDTRRLLEIDALAREFGAPALEPGLDIAPDGAHTGLPVSVAVLRGGTLREGRDELVLRQVAGRDTLLVVWFIALRDGGRATAVMGMTPEQFASLPATRFPDELAEEAGEVARAFMRR